MESVDPVRANDSGKVETAASEACTRSGAFALLLAVALFLLSAYWLQAEKDLAAGQYTMYRTNLAMHVDALIEDPLWQEYLQRNPLAEDTPMSALVHATGTVSQDIEASVKPKPKVGTSESGAAASVPPIPKNPPAAVRKTVGATAKTATATLAPMAPTGLTATSFITDEVSEVTQVREDIEKLNDSALLTRARESSNFFEVSIVRWANKRGAVMYANALTGVCRAPVLELPRRSKSAHYTPQLDGKALADCLTLKNVRDLAKFELPVFSNPDATARRAAREVDVSPGSLPKDPYMATIVGQLLLFLVLTYFAAFTREASSIETFPAPGTLFGAFSGSQWTRCVFVLALWTPSIACCAVFIASGKMMLSIGLIPVALVTLSVQITLEKTSFFGSIKPLAFVAETLKNLRLRRKPEKPASV